MLIRSTIVALAGNGWVYMKYPNSKLKIMKVSRPKTEKWHNYAEGDCGKPIDRDGSNKAYFKKGFWKRYDRKKFFRDIAKWFE